jgi:RNA polymerase sigma-70 factor (ECF subfamily)
VDSLSSLAAGSADRGVGEGEGAEIRALDGVTFEQIYERHLSGIYSYLLAHCRSEEDAADLSQQVFTQALAALPRYRARGIPIATWLFRIARNLLIDLRRRRRPTVSWELLPEPQHPSAGDDVEATVMRRDAVERLRPILDALDADKRDLLALRFAGGLTVPEIASVLNRTEPAVRSELRRILLSLREGYVHD